MLRLAMMVNFTAEDRALSIPGSDQHHREARSYSAASMVPRERLGPSSEWYASVQKATAARSFLIFAPSRQRAKQPTRTFHLQNLLQTTLRMMASPWTLYQFPTRTFIENIIVRPNGHLLLTTFRDGSLFGLDPGARDPEAYLIVQMPDVSALTGIVQIEPDLYAVTGGTHVPPMRFTSMKCFTVDLRQGLERVKAEMVLDVPGTQMLNGMANLPEKKNICLSLDSVEGRVFRLDVASRKADVVYQHALLKPREDGKKVPLGANGAKIHNRYLYFTNSARELFCRLKLKDDDSGEIDGEPEVLTSNSDAPVDMSYDDFDIDAEQKVAYVGRHSDAIYKIALSDGRQELFAGGEGQEIIESPTCCALSKDRKKLFVGCAGKVGEFKGQIVEIDVGNP